MMRMCTLVFFVGIIGLFYVYSGAVAEASAEMLYWNCYNGRDSGDLPVIVEYDVASREQKYYSIDGYSYMIEGLAGDQGVLVAQVNQDELTCDIYRCHNGEIMPVALGFSQPNLRRILAFKGDWIYYVTETEDGHYKYARVNDEGLVQEYPDIDYCVIYGNPFEDNGWGMSRFSETTIAISDEGQIAFCSYSPLVVEDEDPAYREYVYYEELPHNAIDIMLVNLHGAIEKIGYGKRPTWINNYQVLFEREGILWSYDTNTSEASVYRDESGNEIQVDVYEGSIAVNASGTQVAYVCYKPSYLLFWEDADSTYQPIEIVSLVDGTRFQTEPVKMRDRHWVVFRRGE